MKVTRFPKKLWPVFLKMWSSFPKNVTWIHEKRKPGHIFEKLVHIFRKPSLLSENQVKFLGNRVTFSELSVCAYKCSCVCVFVCVCVKLRKPRRLLVSNKYKGHYSRMPLLDPLTASEKRKMKDREWWPTRRDEEKIKINESLQYHYWKRYSSSWWWW